MGAGVCVTCGGVVVGALGGDEVCSGMGFGLETWWELGSLWFLAPLRKGVVQSVVKSVVKNMSENMREKCVEIS